MKNFLQALPAVLATVVVTALAIGLFVPPELLPAWIADRIPQRLPLKEAAPPTETETETEPSQTHDRPTSAETVAGTSPPEISVPITAPPEAISEPLPPIRTRTPIQRTERTRPETDAELMNSHFTPLPKRPSEAPRVVDVPFPRFPSADAIWAGTGRDLQGRIWLGGCAGGTGPLSARLFCYDTQTGEIADVGDVLTALKVHGLLRDGESQMKIHSKILQLGDGHLYFTSMDEQGENPDGSQLPTWGGHLWRLRLPERKWEHLHAAPEALIAVAGMGRYIYALGYFGHTLVQCDTETGSIRTVTVGAVDGHVSRNLLADQHGHVFVPRVTRAENSDAAEASLVEFDAELNELAATPLEGYCDFLPAKSHGITGVQPLADGSLAFVTHRGRLFRIVPNSNGPAEVKDLGWMHPLGEMAIESLFTYDGRTWLTAVAQLPQQTFEWVAFDLKSSAAVVQPLELPARYASVDRGLLLYGSMTRDIEGAFYLVGTSLHQHPRGPIVWRLMPGR